MNKFKQIIEGWTNYTMGSDGKAEERAKICANCSEAEVGLIAGLLPECRLKSIKAMRCKVCGCPLSTKLRSPSSSCPQGKW